MKSLSYQELMTLKKDKEKELKEIEEKHLPAILRYWKLKDELSRITPLLNKALVKDRK